MAHAPAVRPRVALLAHDLHQEGGMERAFYELVRGGSSYVDFVVISATLAPELRDLVEWRRVRIPRRPFPAKFAAYFVQARRHLAAAQVDLVHTLGAVAPVRADVVSVHLCHAGYVARSGRLAPADAPLLRRVNTTISRTLALAAERRCYRPGMVRVLACVSEGLRDEVRAHYPGVATIVTPNGVDAVRFRPDEVQRLALRLELGVDAAAPVVLFVGGDWDRKGLAVALRGLALIDPGSAPAPELWVVGEGDRRRWTAFAAAVGLDRRVRLLGPRADVERFFQAADVLVLPSLYETFSLVAYEAACCGLPVIATRVSGVDELVERGGGGILVERSATAVAQALAALVGDATRRRALGTAGRRFALQFGWPRSIEAGVATYFELLGARQADRVTA